MIADLAVVGAGIIGSFVAYEASRRRPDWDILILERGAVGGGATTWSAGVSFPIGTTASHRELVRTSAERFAALDGTPIGEHIRPLPIVYVVHRDRLDTARTHIMAPLRPVTSDEEKRVLGSLPDLRLGKAEEMVTHDGHGFVVPARLMTESLLSTVVTAGHAQVQVGQRVDEVERFGAGYRLLTAHHAWRSRRVIIATGPWALPVIRPVLPPDVSPQRIKRVCALHARLPVGLGDPLVYFMDDDLFVLPTGHGAALVSFRRDEWDSDPDVLDGAHTEGDLRQGVGALELRSPAAAASVVGARSFCDLYTPRRVPLVRSTPELPGLAAVVGGSGSGVRLAPGLAAKAVGTVIANAPDA